MGARGRRGWKNTSSVALTAVSGASCCASRRAGGIRLLKLAHIAGKKRKRWRSMKNGEEK
jgi:hypothetical protein